MRLSICIPTYNFGAYIEETLASVLPQVSEDVEVVVLDGGSTDNTAAVVTSFRHPALRYLRQDVRGGIDRDLARTLELARGEYCWLFCADDIMKPGAIQHVLARLESGCEVYLCGLTLCSLDMRPLWDHPIAHIGPDEEFDLSSRDDRLRYFERARTTTAFFSFAGSLILKKGSWDAAGPDERFIGSLWAHVAQIFRMIPGGLRLHYIGVPLLYKRTGNDSFMDQGVVERFAKSIDGYHRLASTYFPPDSPEARHIRRVITNEFRPWTLLSAKLDSERAGLDQASAVDRLAATAYVDTTPRNRLDRFLYDHTPRAAFVASRTLGRRLIAAWQRLHRVIRPSDPVAHA